MGSLSIFDVNFTLPFWERSHITDPIAGTVEDDDIPNFPFGGKSFLLPRKVILVAYKQFPYDWVIPYINSK